MVDFINSLVSKQWKLAALLDEKSSKALLQRLPITDVIDIAPAIYSRGDISWEGAQEITSDFLETIEMEIEKANMKAFSKRKKIEVKSANAAQYVPGPVFCNYRLDPEEESSRRWKFETPLRSPGLLERYVSWKYGPQKDPIAVGILIDLPLKKQEDEGRIAFSKALSCLSKNNILVSGGRLGWNKQSKGFPLLIKILPEAINTQAYGHGLNAPVLPTGFISQCKVVFRVLKAPDGTLLETDGSGWYHPDTPELQEFIQKYGLCPIQPRLIHESGLFAKGILLPNERSVDSKGNPCMTFHWNQIKGSNKALAKERERDDIVEEVPECCVGILNAWSRPFKVSGCFEILENVEKNPETKAIVTKLVNRAIKSLMAKGLEGLAIDVGKKDETVRMFLQLLKAGEKVGLKIKPWQIPRVNELIQDRLGKVLYTISQGGGIKVPCKVARIDARIPPGKCVVSGMEPGIKVSVFRFPIVLTQGLLELETIAPFEDYLVKGEMPKNQIGLSIQDIKAAQGDDDGDTFGVSSDPLLVELFKHKLNRNLYAIEPKGKPLLNKQGKPLLMTDSEGERYMERDNRGPVGRATVWRSRALACNLQDTAISLAVGIQECIDQAKRLPDWTDIIKAANAALWKMREDGWMECTVRFPEELTGSGWPEEHIRDWLNRQLIAIGCCDVEQDDNGQEKVKARDPLWWKKSSKKISLENWIIPSSEDTQFENLVHWSARETYRQWMEMDLAISKEITSVDISLLLPLLLEANGVSTKVNSYNQKEMLDLYIRTGLKRYNTKFSELLAEKEVSDEEVDENYRLPTIYSLQKDLETLLRKGFMNETINLSDILTVWFNETIPSPERKTNLNNAFRLVCWEGSPILEMIGIADQVRCPFLNRGEQDRLSWIVNQAMSSPDPFASFVQTIHKAERHEKGYSIDGKVIEPPIYDQKGNPIKMIDCPDCIEEVRTALVRTVRTKKGSEGSQWLLDLHRRIDTEFKK